MNENDDAYSKEKILKYTWVLILNIKINKQTALMCKRSITIGTAATTRLSTAA